MKYSLKVQGVDVGVDVSDTGYASDEILGDATYRFEGDLARLLAPMRFVTYSADMSRSIEQALGESMENATGEAFDVDVDDTLILPVDAGIAAVALLLDKGEAFDYSVDVAEGSDFWAFHDLSHAVDDCSGYFDDGLAEFPPVSAWAEDRANLEGARRAMRAGLSLDEVIGALVSAGDALRENTGETSTALDDLLDGSLEFLPDDVRAKIGTVEAVLERVASTAADAIDYLSSDLDLDDLLDEVREYAEECSHDSPAMVLVALRDFDDAADNFGPGEVVDLDYRAAYAFGGAVVEAARALVECSECEVERRVDGSTTCEECSSSTDDPSIG